MSDKVSIIMPVYNAEKYLNRSINSILSQTYKNIEVILVNDGSKDSSAEICDAFAIKDNRIKVFHQKNSGASAARNRGVENASGKYLQFIDSDDFLEPQCTETLVQNIKDADMVICGFRKVKKGKNQEVSFEKNEIIEVKEGAQKFFTTIKAVLYDTIWNKLYLKDKVKTKFNPKYFMGEDGIFNFEYLHECKKIAVITDILYNYEYGNEGSITHTRIRSREEFNEFWENVDKNCQTIFPQNSHKKFINGLILRGSMLQVMNKTIISDLKFSEYKKLYKEYLNDLNQKQVFKNCDKNYMNGNRLLGNILKFIFKHKFYLLFFIATKFYKKKKFKTKES